MKSILTVLFLTVALTNSISAQTETLKGQNLSAKSFVEIPENKQNESIATGPELKDSNLNKEVKANENTIHLSHTKLRFEPVESQSKIMLTSNCSWAIETNVDWLLSYPNSGNSTTEVLFVAQENKTQMPREGTMRITDKNAMVKTIHVIQNAGFKSVQKILNSSHKSVAGNELDPIQIREQTAILTSTLEDRKQCFYPNPSKGDFTIRGMNQAELSIYSMNGKCLFQVQLTNDNAQISTDLAKGIYLLNIEHKGKILMEKLVIDK